MKEKEFRKKFFEQIALDLGKDGGINCMEKVSSAKLETPAQIEELL